MLAREHRYPAAAALVLGSLGLGACPASVVTTSGSTGSSGSMPIDCSSSPCPAGMLCVVSSGSSELCFVPAADGGMDCGPGAVRAPPFDTDCTASAFEFACELVGTAVCVAVPSDCGAVPTCGCFAIDPCLMEGKSCAFGTITSGMLVCE